MTKRNMQVYYKRLLKNNKIVSKAMINLCKHEAIYSFNYDTLPSFIISFSVFSAVS